MQSAALLDLDDGCIVDANPATVAMYRQTLQHPKARGGFANANDELRDEAQRLS